MTRQEQQLIDLYNNQPHTVDKLGGTDELRAIADTLGISPDYILKCLTDLRKKGRLERKSDRTSKKEPPKPTFGKATMSEDGKLRFDITVVHRFGFDDLAYLVYINQYVYDGLKPVTRQEVYDIIVERTAQGWYLKDHDDRDEALWTEACNVINHLFPELKEP